MGGGGGGMARPAVGGGNVGRPAVGGGNAGRPAVGGGIDRPGMGGGPRPGYAAGGARPSAGQLDRFLDIPRVSTGAVAAAGRDWGVGGGAAADFLQLGGGARAEQRPAGPGTRGDAGVVRPADRTPGQARQNFATNHPNRADNRHDMQGNRQQRRDEIRDQVANDHPRLNFWSNYPGWAAWRIARPYRWATWGAVAGWCGYGEPVTYDYGANVYYIEDQVYYGDQPVATAEDYAQEAQQIAAGAAQSKAEDSEWLPLGVFAMTQDGHATGADPTLFMQLAVNKQGIINGTYSNTLTGSVQKVEGAVDKKTQRVAWGVADQQWPIIETGLSSLTQDTTPALIHFADGQTQRWLLVRLEEPKQNSPGR